MAATAAVTPVRTALGDIFRPVKMGRAGTPVPACAEYPDMIDEVTFCHGSFFTCAKVAILFEKNSEIFPVFSC